MSARVQREVMVDELAEAPRSAPPMPPVPKKGRVKAPALPPLPTFSENEGKRAVLAGINAIPGLRAWGQPAGKLRVRGGWVQLAPAGAGDIVGRAAPDGLHFEVETKGARTAVQPQQDPWALETEAAGAVYIRARARRGDTMETLVQRTVAELLEAIAECRSRRNHDAALRKEIDRS
jgi:hypothetical protein